MTLHELRNRNHLPALLNSMGCIGEGVEVGVFKGQFSNLILSGWPGTLIGVDSYNRGTDFHLLVQAINRNRQFIDEGRYRIVVNDSYQSAALVPSDLDFVYLDADHLYQSVMNDIINWYPKVKIGGLMCGHDYAQEAGVKDAVDEFFGGTVITKPCGSWFKVKA
jgi:hypothetical protein